MKNSVMKGTSRFDTNLNLLYLFMGKVEKYVYAHASCVCENVIVHNNVGLLLSGRQYVVLFSK